MKTNYQAACEVLEGKYGNGRERYEKLTAEGFNYSAVQSIVNVLVEERKRADPGVFLEVEVDLSKYAGLNLKFINGKDEQ